MIPFPALAVAIAVALFLPALAEPGRAKPVQSAPFACTADGFFVSGADAALAAEICATTTDLRAALAACGLAQDRPLTIALVAQVLHPVGACYAAYDCHFEAIKVLDPALYLAAIPPEEPYARLPAPVVLRALLAHEMAHALATQTAPRALAPVDQEYIAAAMELETMDPRWRRVYLDAVGPQVPPSAELVDIWIYALAPRAFAANAWRHFGEPGNGCDLIGRIVAGEASFAPRPGTR